MEFEFIFTIAILLMSVVIHEVAHGYAALFMGDVTAKYEGRLTLNPIKHLDPFGSVILPLILALLPGNLIFGWAKPAPYNPYNLRNRRWGELLVAIAGPISNVIVAIFFGLLIRFAPIFGLTDSFINISLGVDIINLTLATFNMIPVPPLDGSKVIFAILNKQEMVIRNFLERYGLFLVFGILFFAWDIVIHIVFFFTGAITGLN